MMSRARVVAGALSQAWARYHATMDEYRTRVEIREQHLPPQEARVEKVHAYITEAYQYEGPTGDPVLVVECEQRPYMGAEAPRIRLTETEALVLGRFIREHFGE